MNNESENEKILTNCLLLVFGFILIPLLAIYHGWVLTILWGWFVAPTFHLPELNIAVAIGLSLIVGMFRGYTKSDNKDSQTTKDKTIGIIAILISPLLTLFFGWIVHMFM